MCKVLVVDSTVAKAITGQKRLTDWGWKEFGTYLVQWRNLGKTWELEISWGNPDQDWSDNEPEDLDCGYDPDYPEENY
jgi:hypothetical protein